MRLYFTICSANYLAYALTLAASVERSAPGARFKIVLADEPPAGLDLDPAVIRGDTLGVGNYYDMAMRYGIVEFNTAIKPFAIEYFFDNRECDEVYYLDPDLYFFRPLTEVYTLFDQGAQMVLTPHITRPVEDGRTPDDFTFLKTGVFNLGFAAFRHTPEVRAFLRWWARRMVEDCRVDLQNGIFVDQKYLDLAPAFVDRVAVLRHPGYNLAYWNLVQRKLEKAGGDYLVDGEALCFFHFSGVDPDHPERLSKHQGRFATSAAAGAPVAELVERYVRALLDNGHKRFAAIPYAYGRLSDGESIMPEMRLIYGRDRAAQPRSREQAFAPDYDLYNRLSDRVPLDAETPVTVLMRELWLSREDLRRRFDLGTREGRVTYSDWFSVAPAKEHDAPKPVLEPAETTIAAERARQADPATKSPPPARLHAYGATVFGFLRAASGVGEAGRRVVRALAETGLPLAAKSLSPKTYLDRETAADPFIVHRSPYRYHLFAINADNTAWLPYLVSHRDWVGRYKIGIWNWELSKLPEAFNCAFEFVDEVWTPSTFITAAVAAATDKPVITIPYAVPIETPDPRLDRRYFGLHPSALVVLAMMDFNSYRTRKNPLGAIDAFLAAFGDSGEAQLAIKIHGGDAGDREALQTRIGGLTNVVVIDKMLSRAEVVGLQQACDVYLSLHRSEGFGFNIAECMAQGKLVIATDYSGSRQFLDASCGAPVDHTLIPVGEGQYPYGEGQRWADPDLDQAASLLRRALDDPSWRTNLGARARERVARDLSPRAVGYLMRARIDEIEFRGGAR